ncbi:MAG: hypothetical protein M5U01_18225 [Ardenticatenaceae bacterium]|nr:hypothetical protein [Ardenticatenaceae bacterium]
MTRLHRGCLNDGIDCDHPIAAPRGNTMDDLVHLIAPDDDPPAAVIQKLGRLNVLTTPEDVPWRRVPKADGPRAAHHLRVWPLRSAL